MGEEFQSFKWHETAKPTATCTLRFLNFIVSEAQMVIMWPNYWNNEEVRGSLEPSNPAYDTKKIAQMTCEHIINGLKQLQKVFIVTFCVTCNFHYAYFLKSCVILLHTMSSDVSFLESLGRL